MPLSPGCPPWPDPGPWAPLPVLHLVAYKLVTFYCPPCLHLAEDILLAPPLSCATSALILWLFPHTCPRSALGRDSRQSLVPPWPTHSYVSPPDWRG